MKLKMPFYKQTTTMTCWYFSIKMITDYHKYPNKVNEKRFLDTHQAKVVALEKAKEFKYHNGATEFLRPRGFEMLDIQEFNLTTTTEQLAQTLWLRGPLLAVSYTLGHAVVVCGSGKAAQEKMVLDGLTLLTWDDKVNGLDGDENGVWVNDPFHGPKAVGLKELKTGFNYLAWGQKPAKVDVEMNALTNNLWYFEGKLRKDGKNSMPRADYAGMFADDK